ncbi:hypothetical protein D3C80_2009530 [compost metagenome]
MQEALLQRLELDQDLLSVVRAQGQGAQVLGLGPDTLSGIKDLAVGAERSQYCGVFHAVCFGIGKRAAERTMQVADAQQR